MAKVNISLPDELLQRIDVEARVLEISRSGLIQEAAARYIAAAETDRAAEAQRLRIRAAGKRMREIGERMGLGPDADTAALVREAREEWEKRPDDV